MAHDVFISYSHIDKPIADAICAKMEQNGIRCWYAPRDLSPGNNWMSAIMTAIENTSILILVFTGHSNESDQVIREINQAVKTAKIIIPFKLNDIQPNKDIQYLLDVVHWLDAFGAPQEKSINQLVRQVKGLLAPASEEEEPAQDQDTGTDTSVEEIITPPGPRFTKKTIGIAAALAAAVLAVFAGYRISTRQNAAVQDTGRTYVYRDDKDPDNHFLLKEKMWGSDETLVHNMQEDCPDSPQSGKTCIRCEQDLKAGDWGGWLFLSGYKPDGESEPRLNDGSTAGQGIDLAGASALTFYARGEKGGENVEFFTGGFGYDEWDNAVAEFPDSLHKKSLGVVTLENKWQEYRIELTSEDMANVICGFGYVLSGDAPEGTDAGEGRTVFFLDEICFEGEQP